MTIEQEARAEAEMRLDENAWMFRGTRHNAQDLRERGNKMASSNEVRSIVLKNHLTIVEQQSVIEGLANWFEINEVLSEQDLDEMILEVLSDR